jgi:hypothetical protein
MSVVDGLLIWIGSNLLLFGVLIWQRVLEPRVYAYLYEPRRGRAFWQKLKQV